MTPAAILVRVSTNRQDTDRQIMELMDHAAANGIEVVEVVEITVSGGSAHRPDLDRIGELAAAGRIRKVLVHEVSRVARRNSTAHSFLEQLTEAGVSLYWHAQRIETLLPDGRKNPAAMVMFALLSEFAAAERELIAERTRSGLQAARRRGVRLGRSPGTGESRDAFLAKYPEVARLLRKGLNATEAAKLAGTARNTALKVKRLMGHVRL